MGLVDLRGRADEPAVRALLSFAHPSSRSLRDALTRYRDGESVLLGWEDDGCIVACAWVERAATGDVLVRSVAVASDRRGRGLGRSLVDAIAAVANARQLEANVVREGVRVERHAWNRLPSGLGIDLTRSQFRSGEELEEPVLGEPLIANRAGYDLLARRVRGYLAR